MSRIDRPALEPKSAEENVRSSRSGISSKTRAFVLQRDRSTCQMCGAVSGEPHQEGIEQKTRIRVGRILAQSLGGDNDPSNLRAVCSICEEGLRNLALQRPSLRDLLVQLRRSTRGGQIEVLRWLINKYPVQAMRLSVKVEKPEAMPSRAKMPRRES